MFHCHFITVKGASPFSLYLSVQHLFRWGSLSYLDHFLWRTRFTVSSAGYYYLRWASMTWSLLSSPVLSLNGWSGNLHRWCQTFVHGASSATNIDTITSLCDYLFTSSFDSRLETKTYFGPRNRRTGWETSPTPLVLYGSPSRSNHKLSSWIWSWTKGWHTFLVSITWKLISIDLRIFFDRRILLRPYIPLRKKLYYYCVIYVRP